MAYSNNAANIYSFRINRIEPLAIPGLSRLTGPFRYDFMIGGLRGHNYIPNPAHIANPTAEPAECDHSRRPLGALEKISFRPTENLEFGFERTVIWAGKGHGAVNIDSFLQQLFQPDFAQRADQKRLPRSRRALRRIRLLLPAALRPQMAHALLRTPRCMTMSLPPMRPGAPRTGPASISRTCPAFPSWTCAWKPSPRTLPLQTHSMQYGHFMYCEGIQKQGYTNKGQMFGDWIGREDKGGQAWVTYHLSGNEWIQAEISQSKSHQQLHSRLDHADHPRITDLDSCPFNCHLPGPRRHHIERLQLPGRQAHRQGLRDQRQLHLEKWKAPIYTQAAASRR